VKQAELGKRSNASSQATQNAENSAVEGKASYEAAEEEERWRRIAALMGRSTYQCRRRVHFLMKKRQLVEPTIEVLVSHVHDQDSSSEA